MEVFIKGIAAGFIIAVPLGPVSVLCFRRVLTRSQLIGLVTVLGAAAADTIYGLIAALGLTAVTHTLLSHRGPIRICGGVILLYMGVRMIRAHPAGSSRDDGEKRNMVGIFFSSFLLMLANPSIIISFLAVFAAIDLAVRWEGLLEASWLGLGIFLGSAAWWLVYMAGKLSFGKKLGDNSLHMINVGAGSLVCAFGVWQLLEAMLRH